MIKCVSLHDIKNVRFLFCDESHSPKLSDTNSPSLFYFLAQLHRKTEVFNYFRRKLGTKSSIKETINEQARK